MTRTWLPRDHKVVLFPDTDPGGALSNLNFWIRRCTDLYAALRACGMARKAKAYTPKEVALIVYYLGEP